MKTVKSSTGISVLLVLATSISTQTVSMDLPSESKGFVTIAHLLYFTAAPGTLYRTDGLGTGAVPLRSGFDFGHNGFMGSRSLQDNFGFSFKGTRDIIDYDKEGVFSTQREWTANKQWRNYDSNETEQPANFTLVNADTDEDIQLIEEGDSINISQDVNYNIRYDPLGSPLSVVFQHQGRIARTENFAPFSIGGDTNGDYLTWLAATPGTHTIFATDYSDVDGNGMAGPARQVTFTLLTDADSPTFTLVNADTDEDIHVLEEGEVFVKPGGTNINIRFNSITTPGSVVFKHNGEIVRNENDAPYAIAGDRSADYIAWATATSGSHTVEAIPHEGLDGSGVAGPTYTIHFTIQEPRVIEEFLLGDKKMYTRINIYPNPAGGYHPEIRFVGYAAIGNSVQTEIQITNMTGEVVFSEAISCGGGCGEYLVQIDKHLPTGLYLVIMKTNGESVARRLLIK